MTAPGAKDRRSDGMAEEILARSDRASSHSAWCYVPLAEVRRNLEATGYPPSRLRFVVGRVEETLPAAAPDRIALLRLDTDWYESTRHELQHLFPRLSVGGILFIDDYGHWTGARAAVDEFIAQRKLKLFLSRVDYTGRIAVKVDA